MESQREHSPSALPANAFIPRGFQLQRHQHTHKLHCNFFFNEVSQDAVFPQSLVSLRVVFAADLSMCFPAATSG